MNKNLKKHYLSLPRVNNNHLKIRDEIIEACGITQPIFYNWLKGLTPVPKLAQKEIAIILGESVDKLFPIINEEIKTV